MDQKNDSVLFLLQDIKEILFGTALILLAVVVSAMGWLLRDAGFNVEGICLIADILLLAYGAFHIRNGWINHELVEKNGEAQKKEEQGGPHAL